MSKPLSDFQRLALTGAAKRDDRCLVPPPKLKGGPLKAFVDRLIEAGLVKEIPAKATTPTWRTDAATGRGFALKLTAAGAKAAADPSPARAGETKDEAGAKARAKGSANGDGAASHDSVVAEGGRDGASGLQAERSRPDRRARATPMFSPAGGGGTEAKRFDSGSGSAPRSGTKLASLIGLLSREGGATLDEMTSATGWLAHTTRAAMTRLRQRGFAVERTPGGSSEASRFRILSTLRTERGETR